MEKCDRLFNLARSKSTKNHNTQIVQNLDNAHNQSEKIPRKLKRLKAFRKYRLQGRAQRKLVEAVRDALDVSTDLLPDYRIANAVLGIDHPPHAMLKTAVSKSFSKNEKHLEVSLPKRGRKFDRSPIVVLSESYFYLLLEP